MKELVLAFTMGIVLLSCQNISVGNNGKNKRIVSTVPDEPMYLKDRKLEEFSKNRTNSHGTAWPGNGGSYSSSSYRQSAIKAKNDTIADPIEETVENPGYDNLAADTADEGRSW